MSESAADQVWTDMTAVLKSGDVAKIKKVVSTDVYKRLTALLGPNQSAGTYLANLGASWAEQKIAWSKVSPQALSGMLHKGSTSATNVEFKKVGGTWIFEYWNGPGK